MREFLIVIFGVITTSWFLVSAIAYFLSLFDRLIRNRVYEVYPFFGKIVTVGSIIFLFLGLFFIMDQLLWWMPDTWGDYDQYNEFEPLRLTLASVFSVVCGIPIIYSFKKIDRLIKNSELEKIAKRKHEKRIELEIHRKTYKGKELIETYNKRAQEICNKLKNYHNRMVCWSKYISEYEHDELEIIDSILYDKEKSYKFTNEI